METKLVTPTVEELEKFPAAALEQMASIAELAIAKPYFLDRVKTALFLKGGSK